MIRALGFGFLLLLTACATEAQFDAALARARAGCDAARPANATELATERCKSSATRRLWAQFHYTGDGDLREAFLTEREAIAEKVDLGQLTPTQAVAMKAAAASRATSEYKSRATASRPFMAPVICNTFGTVTTCN